jgi:hypothetical protein
MISRLSLAISLVAIAVGALPAYAQEATATSTPVAIPKNSCVKPSVPKSSGTLIGGASEALRMNNFNRDYKAYSDCIKKYVEDTNAIASAANAAGKATIDEFNAVTAEAKARSDAANN